MVDIEAMATGVHASILSIGGAMFDPLGADTEESIRQNNEVFYTAISLTDNQKNGRDIDADTVEWWLRQSQEAQAALLDSQRVNLRQGLTAFSQFISQSTPKPTTIWAKSPDFDCSILIDAFRQMNIIWPFRFTETRCVRTIIETAYPDGEVPRIGVGVAHNALDDTIKQCLMVQAAQRQIHRGLLALEGKYVP